MIVELYCRYTKEADPEQLDDINTELNIQKIIKGEKFDHDKEKEDLLKKTEKFGYNPLVFNLKDVCLHSPTDDVHTQIKLYTGNTFTIKMKHLDFKNIYQSLMGIIINDLKDFVDGK